MSTRDAAVLNNRNDEKRVIPSEALDSPLIPSLICLISIAGLRAWQTRQARIEERKRAQKDAGDIAKTSPRAMPDWPRTASLLPEGEVTKQTHAALRALRDGADGHVAVVDTDGRSGMQPFIYQKQQESISATFKTPAAPALTCVDGYLHLSGISEVARSTGDGFVEYVWNRPASTDQRPKRSHLAMYTP